jgi:hypothetical protein
MRIAGDDGGTGFYRFLVLGAVEVQRCQVASRHPPQPKPDRFGFVAGVERQIPRFARNDNLQAKAELQIPCAANALGMTIRKVY